MDRDGWIGSLDIYMYSFYFFFWFIYGCILFKSALMVAVILVMLFLFIICFSFFLPRFNKGGDPLVPTGTRGIASADFLPFGAFGDCIGLLC